MNQIYDVGYITHVLQESETIQRFRFDHNVLITESQQLSPFSLFFM